MGNSTHSKSPLACLAFALSSLLLTATAYAQEESARRPALADNGNVQTRPHSSMRKISESFSLRWAEDLAQPSVDSGERRLGKGEPGTASSPRPRIEKVWEIRTTDPNLAAVFDRWATAAGMKLLWDARQHFLIGAADAYTGSFEEAIERILASPSIRQSKYPLEACIYTNTPRVLRITRLGDQECLQ